MKQVWKYPISIISIIMIMGCTNNEETSTQTTTQNPTTVQCEAINPVLKSLEYKYASSKPIYIASKDATGLEYIKGSKGSNDSGGSHNEGRNCLSCHNFQSAGTVFTSLNAADNTPGASGYRIKLSTGTVYGSARGTGNSRTYSFPNENFTAQVMDPNGNIVNSSAELSHDASRRACNTCHSATGNNGAPGRITSTPMGSTTPVTTNTTSCVSFNQNILPVLQAKCASCHGSNGNFTVTTANDTYNNISALKGSITLGTAYILDKASNTVGHIGGNVMPTDSAEYMTIKAWLDAGAPNN